MEKLERRSIENLLWSSVSSRRYKRTHEEIAFIICRVFAGNTTVRNELVHILDALFRLEQLTRKEYADITARLTASL